MPALDGTLLRLTVRSRGVAYTVVLDGDDLLSDLDVRVTQGERVIALGMFGAGGLDFGDSPNECSDALFEKITAVIEERVSDALLDAEDA